MSLSSGPSVVLGASGPSRVGSVPIPTIDLSKISTAQMTTINRTVPALPVVRTPVSFSKLFADTLANVDITVAKLPDNKTSINEAVLADFKKTLELFVGTQAMRGGSRRGSRRSQRGGQSSGIQTPRQVKTPFELYMDTVRRTTLLTVGLTPAMMQGYPPNSMKEYLKVSDKVTNNGTEKVTEKMVGFTHISLSNAKAAVLEYKKSLEKDYDSVMAIAKAEVTRLNNEKETITANYVTKINELILPYQQDIERSNTTIAEKRRQLSTAGTPESKTALQNSIQVHQDKIKANNKLITNTITEQNRLQNIDLSKNTNNILAQARIFAVAKDRQEKQSTILSVYDTYANSINTTVSNVRTKLSEVTNRISPSITASPVTTTTTTTTRSSSSGTGSSVSSGVTVSPGVSGAAILGGGRRRGSRRQKRRGRGTRRH